MTGADLPVEGAALLGDALADDPYDPQVAAELAVRLFRALPAMYQMPDLPPQGRFELLRLLAVLAVPLATVRQSVQELHADLFIDTADDAMIPYLAQMVGTALAFPDAESNRRDVRGTVGWRRRKGTPGALEEMASDLTGQAVVLQEGWKRVQLGQDLNLLRLERTAVDIRPAIVAEQAEGPLDALAHAVDVRAVSARTGRSHPRHVAHWTFPTVTFPLGAATPVDRTGPGTDLRFVFDPLGARRPLRARRPTGDRRPFTDRIPERHFAADPARWFDADGGFTVALCGLPAAIAVAPDTQIDPGRAPSTLVADRSVAQGNVAVTLLDRPSRGWRGPVRVEVGLATTSDSGGSWRATPADSFAQRAFIDLDADGVVQSYSNPAPDPGGVRVVLLRLSTPDGAGRFFPGAMLTIAGTGAGAATASPETGLAREGFLAGALHVQVPPIQVRGEWFAVIARDGSLYRIADDAGLIGHPFVAGSGDRGLAPSALVITGPGAAWPPTPARSEPVFLNRAPAPGRGPVVLHGVRAARKTATSYADIAAGVRCALSFALRLERPGAEVFVPFQRLAWTGADPAGATWTALDDAGLPLGAGQLADRIKAIALTVHDEAGRSAVAVRFESWAGDATACPGELAWTTDDGRTVLVHLPQLDVAPVAVVGRWPTDPNYPNVSEAIRLGADGSTWSSESTALRRMSLGDIAPLAAPLDLRRRRVRRRVPCGWDNEDPTGSPPLVLSLTEPGWLDVDVTHGLFAMSATEVPRPWPAGPSGGPPAPPTVTVGYEDGATMHLGALPAAREPVLDRRLPTPTRLVCGSGVLHRDAPPDWHDIPRYPTLTEALQAVSATWQNLTGDQSDADNDEVIQFEDDATYPGEAPVWPSGPSDPIAAHTALLRLTIQVAERHRPTVLIDPVAGWATPAAGGYDSLTLCGVAFGGQGWNGLFLPPTREVRLELITMLHAENTILCSGPEAGALVTVRLCQTGGLSLHGPGVLVVEDSIVDAGDGAAIDVASGRAELTRVSVGGDVLVRELMADSVIFDGEVTVQDRFHGCVRYSRATTGPNTVLPQAYRVVFDVPVRVVSRNRRDPGWWRLREDCDPAIIAGGEDGSELGVFGSVHLAARLAGFRRRLGEFTPAGLQNGIIRID